MGSGSGRPTWSAGGKPLGLQSLAEPVCVVTSVARQPLRPGQAVQQGCNAGVVADLARRHEQTDRMSVRIGHGVKLGVHAAIGASDQSPEAPIFTRRLEAVRCALR